MGLKLIRIRALCGSVTPPCGCYNRVFSVHVYGENDIQSYVTMTRGNV